MIPLLTVVFAVLATANARQNCQSPDGKVGECVIINHCPHLFAAVFENETKIVSKDHVRQSYCGFESILVPKVCCPIESLPRHAPKCGLHIPEGEQDPWIALIGYENPDGNRTFVCGGVLIHKRYVLTAAHCLMTIPRNAKLLSIRFGDYNASPPLDIQVEEIIVHENYNHQNQHNDVALIRLKKKVSFKNGEIRPICLPVNGRKTTEGNYQLAGWEKSDNGNFMKRAGLATVWNTSECRSWYNNTAVRLGESQMCAEGKKKPYLHKHGINVGGVLMDVAEDNSYSVIGIASLKPSCCDGEDHPKIYTKVDKYVNWIFNNLDF